ncbi:3-oxoacyl-ACP synthase [Winogradskyella ursingii]|uniref:3-oxoacyl-ACP synthase n=1 Tax=Winogradskyella ursingii TaxID=2686079 RepID=UPI0015C90FA3|nr:3-oxoacyl-ACP synthase [Winogradskyella ursingii]
MTTKQHLKTKCQAFLSQRLVIIQKAINDIQNSLQSETKSSAGDKHETGRAMLQLEREKAGQQLAEIETQQQILNKIKPESKHQKITLGSIVKTTNVNYFIAISAGEITLEDSKYFAISSATPIARLLISKETGETIKFRETQFTILEIH